MAPTIDRNLPNTFTQQQWSNQPSSTAPLTAASQQFQDQFQRAGSTLTRLAQDSLRLGQVAGDATAYLSALTDLQNDYSQFHQDVIQLANTARTEGSPFELGLANSLGSEARQLITTAPRVTATLTSQQAATTAAISNNILQNQNDIEAAGTYTINGKSFNDNTYTFNGSSQYLDPTGQPR